MRILAITSWWPEPADNGIRLRLNRLLRSLAARHELHLAALCQPFPDEEQKLEALRYCATVVADPRPAEPTLGTGAQLASLWSPWPASVRATWSEHFAATVRRCAARVRPEVVIAFELSSAPYAALVPGALRILDDLEMASLYDAFAGSTGRHRLRRWLTWAKHRAYVQQVLRAFHGYSVVSTREAVLARALAPAGLPAEVVPNGADVDGLWADVAADEDTLIYPGALSYQANFDAMAYFLEAIFPSIRSARPAARLRITGHASPTQVAALPRCEGVELTGFVPDIKGLVARSWAEVVPLRKGSGTRLKILEALALGTPVVSTTKGVEGLALRPGEELLVADTPAEFAAATLLLLSQPGLRAHLAAAGRRAVRQHYDWRTSGDRLDELLERVAALRRSTDVKRAA